MAGANSIYGSGMLELGQTFSLEQVLMDNEIVAMNRKVMEGVPVNEETLAIEAIKEVGVGHDFLGHMSTMENIDLPSDPQIWDRTMLGEWQSNGSTSAVERAHAMVEDIMANHVVLPIDAAVLEKLEAIAKAADEQFVKTRMGQ